MFTLEELKNLLDGGHITQEQYDELAKNAKPTEPDNTLDPEPTPDPDPKPDDALEKYYQSKYDRQMAKERKEAAELKKKYERLQQQMLTDEQKKQLEFEEQQKELEEQKRELAYEKNKMYAVKSMKKSNMADTEETMQLIEKLVVSCEDESDIDNTIALMKAWHDKAVKAEVEKRFKDNGYTPKNGSTLNGGVNPWADGQKNLTLQMEMELNNPEMAAQLKAAAGVK